jgi:magnesium-transporting ATPase (P-type)
MKLLFNKYAFWGVLLSVIISFIGLIISYKLTNNLPIPIVRYVNIPGYAIFSVFLINEKIALLSLLLRLDIIVPVIFNAFFYGFLVSALFKKKYKNITLLFSVFILFIVISFLNQTTYSLLPLKAKGNLQIEYKCFGTSSKDVSHIKYAIPGKTAICRGFTF